MAPPSVLKNVLRIEDKNTVNDSFGLLRTKGAPSLGEAPLIRILWYLGQYTLWLRLLNSLFLMAGLVGFRLIFKEKSKSLNTLNDV